MKSIEQIKNLKGKRVLVRVDFNVTLGDDGIVDDTESYRIEKGLRTLQYLIDSNARVIVIAHIGRQPSETLRPVVDYMNNELNMEIGFIPETVGDIAREAIDNMGEGKIIMLENLRSNTGEKENDTEFAQQLADFAEAYVNDAFAVSHREHASIVGVPKLLPAYAGFQFIDEVKHLELVRDPQEPLVVVMGGLKFKTKLDLMTQFLPTAEHIIVGGGLANRLYRDQGLNIGESLVDDEGDTSHLAHNDKVVLPKNVITAEGPKSVDDVGDSDKILDVDVAEFASLINNAKTILWNGPMGYYEGGYATGTTDMAHMIANSNATSVIGGGDTVTVLHDENILDKFTFVSTAGGAMLDYLVHGTLPAIKFLE